MKRDIVIRPADALKFINAALQAADADDDDAALVYLKRAVLYIRLGQANEMHGFRDNRAGRPLGAKQVNDSDCEAINWMNEHSAASGETTPYGLARLAIEAGAAGRVPADRRREKIGHLGGKWKDRYGVGK